MHDRQDLHFLIKIPPQYMDQTQNLFDDIDEADDMQGLGHQGKVSGTDDTTDLKSPSKSYITISQVCYVSTTGGTGCLMVCVLSGRQRKACGIVAAVSAAAAILLSLASFRSLAVFSECADCSLVLWLYDHMLSSVCLSMIEIMCTNCSTVGACIQ